VKRRPIVTFANVSLLSEPVNGTLVYFISRPIIPPIDPLQAALPKLDLSTFLAAIFSTSLAEKLKTTPRTSLLIPHNDAFKRLGELVSAHLLASSKQDLEKVLLHHVLDSVQYSQSMVNGSQHTFSTLEGSDIQLEQSSNGSLSIKPSGGWLGMRSNFYPQDMLTSTGVIHELSDILLPRSVDLTIGKLVKASKGSTMTTILTKAGFDWVLNGTSPPDDSEWARKGIEKAGWTLLCPTDAAFKGINLTELYADDARLLAIASQHLIPLRSGAGLLSDEDSLFNNRPLPFYNSATYPTLYSEDSLYGDVVFQNQDESGSNTYVVGIKGARGTDGQADWARVLSWGRSTTHGGGGVIQIDRLIAPYSPGWFLSIGAPISVGIVGSLLIVAFFYAVRLIWKKDTTEATYEPIGGFGPDDES
jgi:solute carrier family 25 (mitochondrial carnitine/acylcarnitine transporter), member 20/29